MSTLRVLNDALNEYCPNEMLEEESIKRNFVLKKLKEHGNIDYNWKGGTLVVPFIGNRGGSIRQGALVAESDIGKMKPVRGSVTTPKEIWGAMRFDQRDIMEHDGKVKKASFLSSVLDQMPDFIGEFEENFSTMIANSGNVTRVTSGHASSTGQTIMESPERLKVGQRVELNDGLTATTGYIKSVNLNSGLCPLVTARGGATAVDLSSAGYSANVKVYNQGGYSNKFTSIADQLLPSASGGTSTIFGQTKTDYPYLQAISASGSDITASNLLAKLFAHLVTVRKRGKGNPTDAVMSYKHLGTAMAQLESGSGAYRHVDTKVSPYGYMEITIFGPGGGNLTLVGVNEWPDDRIDFMDWSTMKLYTNGFIKKIIDPDGNAFYKIRDQTDGYSYIVDWCMYGEFCFLAPSKNGVLHTISY